MADADYGRLSCAACSTLFLPRLKLDGTPRRNQSQTCSDRCGDKVYRGPGKGYIGTIRNCAFCSNEYEPKHHVAMYCSKTCKISAFRYARDPLRGKRNDLRKQETEAKRVVLAQAVAERRAAEVQRIAARQTERAALRARPCRSCGSPVGRALATQYLCGACSGPVHKTMEKGQAQGEAEGIPLRGV